MSRADSFGPARGRLKWLAGGLLATTLSATAFAGIERGGIERDRRALQRQLTSHLTRLVLKPPKGTPAEASQLAAASLRRIRAQTNEVLESGTQLDGYTEAHLTDLATRAKRTLEATVEVPLAR